MRVRTARFAAFWALGTGALAPFAAAAQTIKAAELDSIIRKAVVEKQLIGVSVGVMQNGKVILAKGYGVRDIASRDAVTPRAPCSRSARSRSSSRAARC